MSLFDLTGKVAIVTGSSRGIGRSIAEQFAAHGARVVVSSRKADACQAVVDAIRAAGGSAISIPANISDKAGLQHLVDETRRQLGPIDVLVCNAASNPYFGPAAGMSDEVFDKVMRNNVLSNHWLCTLVQPDMVARRDGAIIIVSSIAGLKGTPEIGIYGISKAADMALARNLAVEWGPHNIRVNCIAPGLVKTDFARALYEDPKRKAAAEARFPLRRLGEPEDISGIAVMLASRAGAFITGQAIVADAGATITG